jgi:hypothetical protein
MLIDVISYFTEKEMADPQRRYRKTAPAMDRDLIRKIDEALKAEGIGRKLWYWPAGPRGRLKASAVIGETDGLVRPVTLAALAEELGCDRSDRGVVARQTSLCPILDPNRIANFLEVERDPHGLNGVLGGGQQAKEARGP